jgi:hypothetical protein
LFQAGHGTALDFIYARGVPNSTSIYPTLFDKTHCTLILIDIGFYRDFGNGIKIEKNTENTPPSLKPSEDTRDK